MKDEKHETAPHPDGEGALIEYLDDLLHDPAAGSSAPAEKPVSASDKNKLTDNVHVFDAGRKALRSAPAVAGSESEAGNAGNKMPIGARAGSKSNRDIKVATIDLSGSGLQRASWLSPSLLTAAHQPSSSESKKPEPPKTPSVEAKQTDATTELAQHTPQPEPQAEAIPQSQPWCENGRPVWAQKAFECLIFKVNGLKLAVPLISLGSIQPLNKKLTGLPGQPDWFMGILPDTAQGNLKVLNTALCVMPERYQADSRSALQYVISIHGFAWGLACDTVEKSITLQPEQVKWRTQRSKRPWLAGTVVEYMCSLVDTDGFQQFII